MLCFLHILMEQPKKRIKILFGITKTNFGGAQRYLYDIATRLPQESFEIILVTGNAGALSEKLEKSGIRTIHILSLQKNINPLKEVKTFISLFRILRKERPDIFHVNSSKMGIVGAVVGRLAGIKKIIFTVHGWPFHEQRIFLARALICIISWMTVLLSTKTVVISNVDLEIGRKMPFVKNKFIKIYNGIGDIDFYERYAAREKLFDILKLSQNKREVFKNITIIGTVAELTPNKGLIDAIRNFTDESLKTGFIYIIIGDGEEREKTINIIKKLGLEEKIFLTGYIEDAAKFLRAFDVFWLPSVKEGYPYALLEAMRAKLPLVGKKNVGAIPEIIESNELGRLVEPEEEAGFARATIEIMSQKINYDFMSLKRMGDRYKEMFQETLLLYTS